MDSDIEGCVRVFWEQVFNGRDLDLIDAITAPEVVNHNALPGTPRGPEAQRQVVQRLWEAFPDAHFEIKHLASDGDTVICIGTMSGTHEGTLLGVPPPAGRSNGASATCTASTKTAARLRMTRSATT